MMLVTAIERGKGDSCAVYVEGEYALSLNAETLAEAGLRAGMEVDPAALDDLKRRADLRRARERALYLLEYRAHSRRELVDKLRRSVDEEVAEETADRMEELGLLNDAEYAARLAADLTNLKRYGPARVRQELARRGVPREIADETAGRLEEETDQAAALRALIARKYERYLGDEKGVRKTVNALLRLGYRYDDVRDALRAWAEELLAGD